MTPDPNHGGGADWRPDTYLAFAAPRLRPALDLLQRLEPPAGRDAPARIVDLGCGAGEPTLALARRWPGARIEGVDSSAAMLDEARALDPDGAVSWRLADVADWRPDTETGTEPPDLIYSNACLHWLPEHRALMPRLLQSLAPGGTLAVQMPQSWSLPSHRLMREVLADLAPRLGRSPALAELRRVLGLSTVLDPAEYLRLLRPLGARVEVWSTTYWQILEGDEAVYRWVSSTGLRPVRGGLHDDDWAVFEPEYRRRLLAAYPPEADGTTLFPFPRLFLVAVREGSAAR